MARHLQRGGWGRPREAGASTLEYLGMTVVVALVAGGVIAMAPAMGTDIGGTMRCRIESLTGGGCQGGGGGATTVPAEAPRSQDGVAPARGPEDGGPTTGHEPGTKEAPTSRGYSRRS